MERRLHGVQSCLAGLLCSAFALYGQLQLSTIRGSVTDASGADVAGANVAVTDVKTNVVVRSVSSDAAGNFEVPDVVAGVYRVAVEAPGFKTFVADNIVLAGSQIRRIPVHLEVGALTERITVEAGVSPITTDSAQITSGVQRSFYDNSPIDAVISLAQVSRCGSGVRRRNESVVSAMASGAQSRYSIFW